MALLHVKPNASPIHSSTASKPGPSREAPVDFSTDSSFESILQIPHVKLPAKTGEESQLLTESPY